ncbi:MAG: hypothetical protein IJP91_02295, partial [Synergistaceae bacterium]|nr:hypothetical protein [Synergistaceae bacterium]
GSFHRQRVALHDALTQQRCHIVVHYHRHFSFSPSLVKKFFFLEIIPLPAVMTAKGGDKNLSLNVKFALTL